ncbi:helix-turn-helix domain-containing protein [Paenibacillus terreus]|uniref:helix-turn-helix domain-containing protein n=1 Tax=Paenibacillus terreus TaxID=1387834 RepID=UPI0035CCE343
MSDNTIRETLSTYIRKHNLTFTQFSRMSDVNAGSLSRILQGNKPISIRQLESITSAMNLPGDFFYESYVEECFAFSTSMRRIRPFIFRCAELNRLDLIERIVHRLLDDLSYTSDLFDVAETLYASDHGQAAQIIYAQVSEAERFQHSERLTICRYRLFELSLGNDIEENLRSAIFFEPYVSRLDEADQLDALQQLMLIMGTAYKWKKVDELAVELLRVATIQYEHPSTERKPKRPFYYYILYGWLARSVVCEEFQDFDGALSYVSKYADGESWIREDDEEARGYIHQFAEWATANRYLYRVLSGQADALEEYADFVASRPEEIMYALGYMVKAANLFDFDIDHILERFSAYIPSNEMEEIYSQYNSAVVKEKLAQLFSDLGVYRFKRGHGNAISFILKGLRLAIRINSIKNILNGLTRFEMYREWASEEEKKDFKLLSGEVNRINEKNKHLVILGYE